MVSIYQCEQSTFECNQQNQTVVQSQQSSNCQRYRIRFNNKYRQYFCLKVISNSIKLVSLLI
ncbi:unnamed protein product [Paramecium octaurelia]|uniref:Uncharacterized protein n=1 Tax=Paramecium octaurelia TaxID=43137 RepID=A0A8S1UIF8_PAROT|nr:unnamed protein product [Paramecium octaurelia]